MSDRLDENEHDDEHADAPEVIDAPSPTDLVVEDWFQRHFHGMGAHLDERTHNLLHAAKEDLKRVLSDLPSL